MIKASFVLTLILVIAAAAGYAIYSSVRETDELYDSYTASADRHTVSAYVPGVGDNPIRRELNQSLSGILGGELTDAERLEMAERGLLLLSVAEEQVDAIGAAGEIVEADIIALESGAADIGNIYMKEDLEEVAALAREKLDIIADIRALSYRANFHMQEIFSRVVADGGALSDAYVAELNRDLPKVEEQYNQRTNLYIELEDISAKITALIAGE